MIKPGDIVLTSPNNIFVKLMGWFQDDPVRWGHALIVAEDNKVYTFGTEMHVLDLYNYLNDREQYIIFRYKNMTKEKLSFMLEAMKSLTNLKYGWSRLFLFLLDNIFKTHRFTKMSNDKKIQVCSSSVAWIYYVAFKIKFNGVDWRSVDPDDIDDHCSNSSDWCTVMEVRNG